MAAPTCSATRAAATSSWDPAPTADRSSSARAGSLQTAFFDHNQYWWSEKHTNLTTGEVIYLSANGLFQETRAVPLGGTLFMFSSVNAGQPFVIRDAAGNVLLRDRGAIKETVVFDTEGDDVPGGIFIESVSLSVAGPHSGIGFDTCDILG